MGCSYSGVAFAALCGPARVLGLNKSAHSDADEFESTRAARHTIAGIPANIPVTGESVFVQISGFFDQGYSKITTSDEVCEIAEEAVAERIIGHVLDNCAAVSIRVGPEKFLGSRVREAAQN
jgi:hypothetical protein